MKRPTCTPEVTPRNFAEKIEAKFSPLVNSWLKRSLFEPAGQFLNNPGKQWRAQCVSIGWLLAHSEREPLDISDRNMADLQVLKEVIEAVHSGSLIIDDFEDQSKWRRGKPTLHRLVGEGLAVNTGNWLYFAPLERIASLDLDRDIELGIYRAYHRALAQAHMGQALDLSVPIEELSGDDAKEICLASLDLKTGVLMGFAFELGAWLASGDHRRAEKVHHLGRKIGVCLQMFDDIGNLMRPQSDPKRFEDLYLQRPSFFWHCLAEHESLSDRNKCLEALIPLKSAARECAEIEAWLNSTQFIPHCLEKAHHQLNSVATEFENEWPEMNYPTSQKWLSDMTSELKSAYLPPYHQTSSYEFTAQLKRGESN